MTDILEPDNTNWVSPQDPGDEQKPEPDMNAFAEKQAWSTDYWENDNFPMFLRWYARTDRKDAIHTLGINDIIDIVEKPWLKPYRKAYETYLKLIYNDESE